MSGPERDEHDETRRLLLDYVRGVLEVEAARALEAHATGCVACAAALAEERTVNELLRTRLATTKAPERLQRAVAAQVAHALASSGDQTAPLTAAGQASASDAEIGNAQRRAAGQMRGDDVDVATPPLTAAAHSRVSDAEMGNAQRRAAGQTRGDVATATLTAAGQARVSDAGTASAQPCAAGHMRGDDVEAPRAPLSAAGLGGRDEAEGATAPLLAAAQMGAGRVPTVDAGRVRGRGVTRRGWLIASVGTVSLAAAGVLGFFARDSRPPYALQREALNDHLRVLYAQNPVEVPNGGLHQVKPWFTGRIDFAPDVTFVGDDEFPMMGGAVGYFFDRKAASFVFKRRLHTISLFVFRSDGLEWQDADAQEVAGKRVQVSTLDGFHLVYWEAEGLGHVLVSDVSSPELLHLAEKLRQ